MSAAAQITETRTVVPELHAVEATGPSLAEMHDKEMYRWMTWFGIPVIVMAIFMGATFVTGGLWRSERGLRQAFGAQPVLPKPCTSAQVRQALQELRHQLAA